MKKLFVVFLVVIVLSCLSVAVANAENSIYLDYSALSLDHDTIGDIDIDTVTLGAEYSDRALIGILYQKGLDYDPDFDNLSSSVWLLYGGYNFIHTDRGSLGAVLAYGSMNFGGDHFDTDVKSLSIGFKGDLKVKRFDFSLMYLYGINNDMKYQTVKFDDDVDFSMVEFKAGYNFTKSFGMYLSYRQYMMGVNDVGNDVDGDLSGFGLGLKWTF